jgi:hypothetical protein
MLRNLSLVLALCAISSPLWLPQGAAIECYECNDNYANSTCGLKFSNNSSVGTVPCNGTCAVYTRGERHVCEEKRVIVVLPHMYEIEM